MIDFLPKTDHPTNTGTSAILYIPMTNIITLYDPLSWDVIARASVLLSALHLL